MAKAFLSHSSADKELVRGIAQQLGNSRCIFDEISFEPGRKTIQEIFRTLEDTDVFVFFISQKSLESPWVKKEVSRANVLLRKEEIDRIYPIIIDPSITYKTPGIPKWLANPYNLRYIGNPVLIKHEIEKALREVNIKKNLTLNGENIFIGRNEELSYFERDINNLDNWVPSCIIAHSFYDGMGRRSFLKHALQKTNLVRTPYSPLVINLDANESVESFICRLGMIDNNIHPEKYDFSMMDYFDKVNIGKESLLSFVNNGEIVFFVDPGAIVLPNGRITDWFDRIINSEEFDNNLTCCLLSTYRPHNIINRRVANGRGLCYDITELSKDDTKSLFVQLLKNCVEKRIEKEDSIFFLEHLKGIPNQVKYAVGLISNNLPYAKQHIQDIIQYSDSNNHLIVDQIQSNTPKWYFQLLLLLAKSDVLKYDLIYETFADHSQEEVDEAMVYFSNLSIISYLYGGYEYIHLSSSLSDYLNRNKYHLEDKYNTKLKTTIRRNLASGLDKVLSQDYSQFLLTLQSMIEDHQRIPPKFFIPSFILKGIIREYDCGHYDVVIEMCEDLLNNRNSANDIIREVKYYLALSYARRRNTKFMDIIIDFVDTPSDYNFLYGFYYRNQDNPNALQKAKQYFEAILSETPNNKRAKRELVNTLLAQEKYDEAIAYAEENYSSDISNIFHIHSYFQALIKQTYISDEHARIIEQLMEVMRARKEKKAVDFFRCMEGEYAYYINGDYEEAINILNQAKRLNENSEYPERAIKRINHHREYSRLRSHKKK